MESTAREVRLGWYIFAELTVISTVLWRQLVDAMGVTVFGDILSARIEKRGAAGVVTDGVARDVAGRLRDGSFRLVRGAPHRHP